MDITTSYLGLTLRSPLVPSASPLSENPDNIRRMEDAGAGAVVFHSLFEEQIRHEQTALDRHLAHGADSFAEARTFFPEPDLFRIGPEQYLDHLRRAKEAVDIPVIASLNGTTAGGWIDYAARIQEAGADALELNLYRLAADPARSGARVELEYLDVVRAVRNAVTDRKSTRLNSSH